MKQPPARRWLRLAGLALGAALMAWLPFEDTRETWVVLFAMALCAWAALHFILPLDAHARFFLSLHTLLGLLAGLAVAPASLLLMAFKSGLHGHNLPDFTAPQIMDVIYRAPAWSAAGLLLGLGSGMLRRLRSG